jgi:hypothetical protein
MPLLLLGLLLPVALLVLVLAMERVEDGLRAEPPPQPAPVQDGI